MDNKNKLSINSADVQKDRKKRQQRKSKCINILNKYIFWANLDFRVRGQKADCDGQTDKVFYTNSCDFWK